MPNGIESGIADSLPISSSNRGNKKMEQNRSKSMLKSGKQHGEEEFSSRESSVVRNGGKKNQCNVKNRLLKSTESEKTKKSIMEDKGKKTESAIMNKSQKQVKAQRTKGSLTLNKLSPLPKNSDNIIVVKENKLKNNEEPNDVKSKPFLAMSDENLKLLIDELSAEEINETNCKKSVASVEEKEIIINNDTNLDDVKLDDDLEESDKELFKSNSSENVMPEPEKQKTQPEFVPNNNNNNNIQNQNSPMAATTSSFFDRIQQSFKSYFSFRNPPKTVGTTEKKSKTSLSNGVK
ncbi:conserved hypothetical protein [Pediculus humanus corporis]|uniref:Uncharacterized protein n=1 Tax=Pediculus humanus subsp. corporis TaxID=121224 RepID=E0VV98_PEDHC|nr:uncharacterized protein Phum_PHUM460350 [Pediculus humanus corporis]EEB17304.1 conserved hypothetical protein [Pediculus humanus corporis]